MPRPTSPVVPFGLGLFRVEFSACWGARSVSGDGLRCLLCRCRHPTGSHSSSLPFLFTPFIVCLQFHPSIIRLRFSPISLSHALLVAIHVATRAGGFKQPSSRRWTIDRIPLRIRIFSHHAPSPSSLLDLFLRVHPASSGIPVIPTLRFPLFHCWRLARYSNPLAVPVHTRGSDQHRSAL